MRNLRYMIDTTNNGYILIVKELPDIHIAKMVFMDLQSLFEEVDKREAEEGRHA